MTRAQWEMLVKDLAAAWPDAMTKEREDLYFETLRDLEFEAVQRGVLSVIREPRETLPPPGVIRQRALAARGTHGSAQGDSGLSDTDASFRLQSFIAAGTAIVLAVPALVLTWAPFAGETTLWDLGDQNGGLRVQAIAAPGLALLLAVVWLLLAALAGGKGVAPVAAGVAAAGGATAGLPITAASFLPGLIEFSLGSGVDLPAYLLLGLGAGMLGVGIWGTAISRTDLSRSTGYRLSAHLSFVVVGIAAGAIAAVASARSWWNFDGDTGPTGFDAQAGKVLLGIAAAAGLTAILPLVFDTLQATAWSAATLGLAAGLFGVAAGGFIASASLIEPIIFGSSESFVDDIEVAGWLTAAIASTLVAVASGVAASVALTLGGTARHHSGPARRPA